MAGDALAQVDGKGFDLVFLFTGGGFENQLFGPSVHQQDGTGLGIQNTDGRFQNQFEEFLQILGR